MSGEAVGASVDNHHDGVSFFERGLCLAVDFRWNKRLVIGNNAAGNDQTRGATSPVYFAVDAVAGYVDFRLRQWSGASA